MHPYVSHVRLKNGEYEAGADFYKGDVPKAGEIVQIVVCGQALKGRVSAVIAPQTRRAAFKSFTSTSKKKFNN